MMGIKREMYKSVSPTISSQCSKIFVLYGTKTEELETVYILIRPHRDFPHSTNTIVGNVHDSDL